VDGLWATKSEDVGLIDTQLVSKIFNLCGPDPPMSQMDRQTNRQADGQTTCDRKTALCTIVHRAVKIVHYLEHHIEITTIDTSVMFHQNV